MKRTFTVWMPKGSLRLGESELVRQVYIWHGQDRQSVYGKGAVKVRVTVETEKGKGGK